VIPFGFVITGNFGSRFGSCMQKGILYPTDPLFVLEEASIYSRRLNILDIKILIFFKFGNLKLGKKFFQGSGSTSLWPSIVFIEFLTRNVS
jgi:hypothetical protein